MLTNFASIVAGMVDGAIPFFGARFFVVPLTASVWIQNSSRVGRELGSCVGLIPLALQEKGCATWLQASSS